MKLYKIKDYLEPMLIVDCMIDANQQTVYNAWTDLEVFEKWFRPTGFTVSLIEMDLKVGGYFKVHMKSPEGEIYPTKGEYLLLEEPNRIVYKDSWDDERENNQPTIAEIVFEAQGNKTLLKIYSSFASKEQKESILKIGVADGWKMFLNNLSKVLAIKHQI